MVKKFTLSEASKEILMGSVNSKKAQRDSGPSKLTGDAAYGTKEAGDIGTRVTTTGDAGPNPTKGMAGQATKPGTQPAADSKEPMHTLDADKNKQNSANKSFAGEDGQEKIGDDDYAKRIARKSVTTGAPQKFEKTPKSVGVQSYAKEETEGETMTAERREKIQEDIAALVDGENLSEEFIAKATAIFEAAVTSRVTEIAAEVESELHEQFDAAVIEMKEEFSEKIDDYLNYMVEEWMKENELAIETGLRAEIVEGFINGMRDLFAEHYIDIPEEKVNVVEELAAKVEELEAALNEQIESAVVLTKEISEHKKMQALHAVCEGLTQTQVEKLKTLAEGVEFTSEEEFTGKLVTLKEAYAPTSPVVAGDKSALEEGIIVEEVTDKPKNVSTDYLVNAAAKQISKSVVK